MGVNALGTGDMSSWVVGDTSPPKWQDGKLATWNYWGLTDASVPSVREKGRETTDEKTWRREEFSAE